MRGTISRALAFVMVIVMSISLLPSTSTEAALKKVKLNKKSVQVTVGRTTKVTLKNAGKKVKWTIGDKKIVKITKKSGSKKNKITMKGKKTGSTKITAKCGKKKYTVKVKVVAKNVEKEAGVTPHTTKPTAETTKAVAETTKSIEETTKNSEQTTKIEETTTEETTTEEMTEPEENFQIVATVPYDKITVDEDLDIEYSVSGNTDKEFYFGEEPGKLEIYEDGIWSELQMNDGVLIKDLAHLITSEYGNSLTVPLNYYYQDIRPGHYRYTHKISGMDIPVEFDIYDSDTKVIGIPDNAHTTVGDDLRITYYSIGKEGIYSYYNEVGKLEILENGIWSEMEWADNIVIGAMGYMLFPGECNWFDVELSKWYKDIRPGHYRYTHKISEMDIPVEFDICESDIEIVGTVLGFEFSQYTD